MLFGNSKTNDNEKRSGQTWVLSQKMFKGSKWFGEGTYLKLDNNLTCTLSIPITSGVDAFYIG